MNYDGARRARESIAATAVKSSTLGSLDNAVFDALPGAGQCPNLLKVGAPLPRRTAVPQHRRHQIRTLPGAALSTRAVAEAWMNSSTNSMTPRRVQFVSGLSRGRPRSPLMK